VNTGCIVGVARLRGFCIQMYKENDIEFAGPS